MKLPAYTITLYLLLFSGLLAGCRSEKATFYFPRPLAQATPRAQAPKEPAATAPPAAPSPAVAAVPPAQAAPPEGKPARRHQPTAPARARRLALLPLKPLLQPARVGRLLAARLVRPATEHAHKADLSNGARSGLFMIGAGVLLFLIIALLATSIGTLEGLLLLLMGYAFAIGLLISGLVILVVAAFTS